MVAITEADVPHVSSTTPRPTGADGQPWRFFAQPYEYYRKLLKGGARGTSSASPSTVWGFTDSDSWVPGNGSQARATPAI